MSDKSKHAKPRRPDFGGIPGHAALMIGLPLVTFALWAAVKGNRGSLFLWRMTSEGKTTIRRYGLGRDRRQFQSRAVTRRSIT